MNQNQTNQTKANKKQDTLPTSDAYTRLAWLVVNSPDHCAKSNL